MQTTINMLLKAIIVVALVGMVMVVFGASALQVLGCSRPRTHDGVAVLSMEEWYRTRDDTNGRIIAVGPVDLLGAIHEVDRPTFVSDEREDGFGGMLHVLVNMETPAGLRWATWPANAQEYALGWRPGSKLSDDDRLVVTFACRNGHGGAGDCAAMKIERYVPPGGHPYSVADKVANASIVAMLVQAVYTALAGPIVTQPDGSCHQTGVATKHFVWPDGSSGDHQVREFACEQQDREVSTSK